MFHDDVIKWKYFLRSDPLCGEFTGHRWIPHTKASDGEIWCFLWSAPWINVWSWWFETTNRKSDWTIFVKSIACALYLATSPTVLCIIMSSSCNILKPRQDGRLFPGDILKCISWIKMLAFRLNITWSLPISVQLRTLRKHWRQAII